MGGLLVFVTTVAVSCGALALTLLADGGAIAQSVTLVVAWIASAVVRFALLRSWVFRDPPTEAGATVIVTRS